MRAGGNNVMPDLDSRVADIGRRVSAAFQFGHHLTVDEWAESPDGLYLSDRNTALPGPIRFGLTPYVRFPMRCFTNPHVERIGGCWGTQTGKTTCEWACLGYVIDQDPGPTLLMYPTENVAKAVSKDRLQPLITDCPSLSRHLTGRADDFQLLSYTFDRVTVRFAFAESPPSVRSHPMRYVFKDESSAVQSAAWSEVDSRTKTFWNRKIVEFTTPRLQEDSIWSFMGLRRKPTIQGVSYNSDDWESGSTTSVYWYWVPCPLCGAFQRLEFRGLRWPEDCAIRDLDARGWYECEACKGRITDTHKPGMLAAGEWRSSNPGSRWVGLHLNSLYAPWDSCRFGAIAAAYLRARRAADPDQEAVFIRDWLALPYNYQEAGATLVSDTAIEKHRQQYLKNQVPEAVKALVIGADVRELQVHVVVVGFGANSETWRITWQIFADLAQFEEWVKRVRWQHPTAGEISITTGGIDSRYKTYEVIELCRRLRFLRAVRGEETVMDNARKAAVPWRTTILDRDARGKALPGGLQGYRVNTLYFKELIYARVNHTDPAAPDLWHVPADRDEAYERHLQSEQEIVIRQRGTGRFVRKWVTRKGYESNHFLDCEVYAHAVAHAYKLFYLRGEDPVLPGYYGAPAGGGDVTKPREGGASRRAPYVDPTRIRLST